MEDDALTCAGHELAVIEYARLDEAARGALDRHLATCTACRHLHEEMQAMHELFDELPEREPPPDFAACVMAAVNAPAPTASARMPAALLGLLAGAGAAFFVLTPTASALWGTLGKTLAGWAAGLAAMLPANAAAAVEIGALLTEPGIPGLSWGLLGAAFVGLLLGQALLLRRADEEARHG